jgi:hypothetical protein
MVPFRSLRGIKSPQLSRLLMQQCLRKGPSTQLVQEQIYVRLLSFSKLLGILTELLSDSVASHIPPGRFR